MNDWRFHHASRRRRLTRVPRSTINDGGLAVIGMPRSHGIDGFTIVLLSALSLPTGGCADDYSDFVKHPAQYKGRTVTFKRLRVTAVPRLDGGDLRPFEVSAEGEKSITLNDKNKVVTSYLLEEIKGSTKAEFKFTFRCTEGDDESGFGNVIVSAGTVAFYEGWPWWAYGLTVLFVLAGIGRAIAGWSSGHSTETQPSNSATTDAANAQLRGDPHRQWTTGDRVLAKWSNEPYYYPAVVQEVAGAMFTVHYDDGDKAQFPAAALLPLSVPVGSRVFARWQGERLYYPAVVTEEHGDRIHLKYDDGREEWTTVGLLRVLPTFDAA